jgi:hypothetical protein
MSSQSPVVWCYREVVAMCVEAGILVGTEFEISSLTDVFMKFVSAEHEILRI